MPSMNLQHAVPSFSFQWGRCLEVFIQRHFEHHAVTMGTLEILEKQTCQRAGSSCISVAVEAQKAKYSLVKYIQMVLWLQVLKCLLK